jgi:CTP synthase
MNDFNCQFENTKIFILGSVCSGLGKGNFAASLGKILNNLGYKIVIRKIDGYLNIDAGTINPMEHGEVFVTKDGQESDLDLGTYERFMNYDACSNHITTMGKIIFNTLMEERNGKQLGKTIENYHIENLLLKYINQDVFQENLINIIEIGGVIGHDNQDLILKAINKVPNKIVMVLSYGLWLNNLQEYKALPMIFGLQTLQRYGIKADFVCIRTEKELDASWQNYFTKKINNYFNFQDENMLFVPDLSSSYGIYSYLLNHNLQTVENVIQLIKTKHNNNLVNFQWGKVYDYQKIIDKVALYESYKNQEQPIKILILGKYNDLYDSYNSIYHALYHSSAALDTPITIVSKKIDTFNLNQLDQYQGIIIPGGFGYNCTDLLVEAIGLCREKNIPILGICLGLQLMVIEGLNNVCKIPSTSQEFINENPHLNHLKPCIHIIEESKKASYGYKIQGDMGGNMRLGSYDCCIKADTLAMDLYEQNIIEERHRHRYEVNNEFVPILENNGYVFSGKNASGNLMEIIEYPKNKFFIGCQFHPELKSKISEPHPLFLGLIQSCKKN